ncbi:hypothetical protein BaRGS_00029987 [Batillaria attramentaria]|uniref:Uncharacterized protein n=1 Tax=Batillaria attramentaria TaxID=370345 RepID=A0ABD0JUK9_9CAEN
MAVENIVDQPESPQYSDHEELIDIVTRSPEESGDTDDKLAVETMVNQPESPQHSDHDDFIDIVGDDHPETVVNQPESPQHSDQEDLIDVVGDDQPETVVNQPESPQHSDPEELIDVVCDDQPADAERSLEVNVTSEETGDIDNSMAVEAGTDEPESPQLSDPEELIDVVRLDDKSDVTRSPEVNRTSQARETSVVTSSEEHVSSSTRGGEKETTTALCPSSTTQHAVEDSILCAANTAQQDYHLPPPPETTASGRLHSDFSAGCTGVTDTPTQTSRQIRQKRPRPGDNDDTDEEESSDDDADDSSDDLLQAALRLFNKDDGRRFQERHEAQKRTHSGALKEHPHSMAAEGKENRRDSACVGHEDGERSSRKHKSKKHKKKKAKRVKHPGSLIRELFTGSTQKLRSLRRRCGNDNARGMRKRGSGSQLRLPLTLCALAQQVAKDAQKADGKSDQREAGRAQPTIQ